MSKESIVAVIIGFCIGLLVAVLILFGPRILEKLNANLPFLNKSEQTQIRLEDNTTSKDKDLLSAQELVINNPIDLQVFIQSSNKILIKGKTKANTKVVGLSLVGQAITTSDKNGIFEMEINLLQGKNIIQVVSYNENTESAEITVYYAKE